MKQILALTTCPDMDVARRLAHVLVEQHLAACVNILPGATSVYKWQGKIEEASELVLLIKSREERLDEIRTQLVELHPYELPELIVVPIEEGLPAYLAWIDSQLEN